MKPLLLALILTLTAILGMSLFLINNNIQSSLENSLYYFMAVIGYTVSGILIGRDLK